MSSHPNRLTSNRAIARPSAAQADAARPSPEKRSVTGADLDLKSIDAAPIATSQRLPLIAHALREAHVEIAELRYEGRGGLGGFITELHDRHRTKSLTHAVDSRVAQQLTGFLWQLVLRRNESWSDGSGSFGVVTWNLKTDLIRHVHHQRIIEMKTTLIEGL
jgi:hypothetical protein